MFQLFLLSLATAAFSLTVAKGKIFAPLRNFLRDHWEWGAKLVTCGYCISHWVAFALVGVLGGIPLTDRPVLDWAVTSFAVVGFSAILSGMMVHLLLMRDAQVQELQEKVFQIRKFAEAAVDEAVRNLNDGKPPAGWVKQVEGQDSQEKPPWTSQETDVSLVDTDQGAVPFTEIFKRPPRKRRSKPENIS